MLFWQVSGILAAAMGVYALFLSWKRSSRSWPLVLTGWSLIFACVLAWAQTSGIDKGPALGLIVFMLAALTGVLIVALSTPVKARRKVEPRQYATALDPNPWQAKATTAGSVLAIIVCGLIVSLTGATAIFMANRWGGMEHTANLTWSMFSFPMLWAAVSVFIGFAQSRSRKVLWLLTGWAISIAIILITMQGN